MAEPIITLKIDGTSVTTHPVFGDDIKIKFSKEKGQAFHRTTVEGTVKFVREDFDLVASCSHNSILTIGVYNGSTLLGECDFIKSDCELDYDDKVCTVKIATKDRYEDFLAKYDNKYDLPRLAPPITPLTLHKRPILQFYFLHDNKVTNVFGNMSFEVNARSGAEDKAEADVLNCGFTKCFHWRKINIPISSDYPSIQGVSGNYIGQFTSIVEGSKCWREDNQYYLQYSHYTEDGYDAWLWILYNGNGTVYNNSGRIFVQAGDGTQSEQRFQTILWGASFGGSALTVGFATSYNRVCYVRALSDYDGTITGETKVAMNSISEDIAEDNYNYRYAWTVGFLDLSTRIIISDVVQAEPTEYGIDGDGNYFVAPTPSATENAIYPIGWSMWIPVSIWFESSPSLDATLRSNFDTTYELHDAYAIHDAINLLLQAMGVPYDFKESTPYSNFFFGGSNSILDTVPSPYMRGNSLFITPITNVKKTRYEQPARKGEITLKQVLDMLRKVYQCYWCLDGVGRLVIEHISYFKNLNYITNLVVDLTAMKDMPNGKMWDFDTNTIKFDRKNCPSRYEFAWGNDVTEQFNGYPIDILDKPAEGTGKEENTATNFTADIDYTVIYPQGVNDDIYAVMEAGKNTKEVQIVDVTLLSGNPVYSMQNGYLSFLYAEQNYWPYDLGGWDARVEGQMMPVYAVRHLIAQNVGIPLYGRSMILPDDFQFVKTGMGTGMMKEASINIDTMFSNTDITMQAEKDDYKDSLRLYIALYTHGNYAIFMQNNTNTVVDVKYKYQGGSVLNTTIWGNSNHIVASGSQSSLDINDVEILTAKQTSLYNVCVGEVMKRYGSHIEVSIDQSSPTDIIATFDGQGFSGGYDFAFIKVHIIKNCSIKITPSTENGYDYGYVAVKPCATGSQVTSPGIAFVYASGTTVKTGSLTAGQDVFIGYLKDSSGTSGNDKVVIELSQT